MHAEQVRMAEPYDPGRFHKLVHALLALVTLGDTEGMEPLDAPWEVDDQLTSNHAETRARCRLPMPPTAEVNYARKIDRMELRRDVSDLLAVVRTTGSSWTRCWAERMPDN